MLPSFRTRFVFFPSYVLSSSKLFTYLLSISLSVFSYIYPNSDVFVSNWFEFWTFRSLELLLKMSISMDTGFLSLGFGTSLTSDHKVLWIMLLHSLFYVFFKCFSQRRGIIIQVIGMSLLILYISFLGVKFHFYIFYWELLLEYCCFLSILLLFHSKSKD